MIEYNKQVVLKTALLRDPQIDLELTEELLGMCSIIGTNAPLFRGIYRTLQREEERFISKPPIGAEVSFVIDYEGQLVTFTRLTLAVEVPLPSFLRLLGWVDACYSTIYPIGTVVELDIDAMPKPLQTIFQEDEPGPLVLLVGRKIPLREGFSDYMVDYLAYLWPFGQLAVTPPIYVSNMMIKRVISTGLTNETEEKFVFSALRALPMANNQLSTAFMPRDLSLKFIEEFNQAKAVG